MPEKVNFKTRVFTFTLSFCLFGFGLSAKATNQAPSLNCYIQSDDNSKGKTIEVSYEKPDAVPLYKLASYEEVIGSKRVSVYGLYDSDMDRVTTSSIEVRAHPGGRLLAYASGGIGGVVSLFLFEENWKSLTIDCSPSGMSQ